MKIARGLKQVLSAAPMEIEGIAGPGMKTKQKGRKKEGFSPEKIDFHRETVGFHCFHYEILWTREAEAEVMVFTPKWYLV